MKKSLLAIVSLLVVLFIFASAVLPMILADHDCSHGDCAVCALISVAKDTLCLLCAVTIAGAALLGGVARIRGAVVFADLSAHTPFGMRVKLSD